MTRNTSSSSQSTEHKTRIAPVKATILSGLNLVWALENADTLSIEAFVKKLHYSDKHKAHNRFKDIISSNMFNNCPQVERIVKNYNSFKASRQENAF
jgi:hypothetical protein